MTPINPILFVVALLILIFFLRGLRRYNSAPLPDLDTLFSITRPVDILAFRNLVDPTEEAYLRGHLRPAAFRAIQRERIWAALEYVQRTGHNATLLVRAGQAAQAHPDANVSAAARELVNHAIELRLHAAVVQFRLYARLAIPGSAIHGSALATRYQGVRENFGRLTHLQDPMRAAHILTSF